MSNTINTNFKVNVPAPIDSRLLVSTFAALSNIAVVFVGLKVYVVDEDKEYRYYDTGWREWQSVGNGGGDGVWGSITGVLTDQTDLSNALNLKFDKAGGIITGETTVQDFIYANDFVVVGSQPTINNPYIQSTLTGEPAGSSLVLNIVFISQADYDAAVIAGSLVVGTHYIIT